MYIEEIYYFLPSLVTVYAATLVAFISPGPNFLGIVSSSVHSRKNGVLVALGISVGTGIWALFAATGITTLLSIYENAEIAMQILGGGYLCWLGYKSLRSVFISAKLIIDDGDQSEDSTAFASFRKGLLIQMTNPKTALYWLAITSIAISPASPMIIIFLLVTGCLVIAVFWHALLALVFSSGPARSFYLRLKPWISGLFGILFITLGLRLVFNNLW